MTTTISTVAQKGGVGKTTTAVALALNSSIRGFKTVFIDFDSQANGTSSFVNIDDVPNDFNSYTFLTSTSYSPLSINKNLFLIPATLDLLKLEDEGFESFFTLKEKIDTLLKDFDLIIIDTPGTLKTSVIAALTASNYVYSPLELTSYSVSSFTEVNAMMDKVRKRFNPNLSFMGFVLNRVHGFRVTDNHKNLRVPNQISERDIFNKYFKDGKGVLSMISERADIRKAIQQGQSVKNGSDTAAEELNNFCQSIFDKIGLIHE